MFRSKYYPTKFNPQADKNTYTDRQKLGDYPIDCDICGCRAWFSTCIKQSVYTGKGNTIACPNCQDNIHWGMVPYKVLPESPVPIVKNAQPSVTTASSIDFTTMPPKVSG